MMGCMSTGHYAESKNTSLGSKYLSLMNQMFGKQPGPLVEVLNGHALCKKNKLIRLESPPTVRNP